MLTKGLLFRQSFYTSGAQMRKFFVTLALLASVAGGALAGMQVGYASITHEMRLYRSLSRGLYEFGGLLGGLSDTFVAIVGFVAFVVAMLTLVDAESRSGKHTWILTAVMFFFVNFAVFYLTTYKSGPVWLEVVCAACTGFAALVALPFQQVASTQANGA